PSPPCARSAFGAGGTAFRLNGAGYFDYLCNFADSGLTYPGPFIQTGDWFYGIGNSGSASTLFKMDFNGVATPLHDFDQISVGNPLRTPPVAADGHLFGPLGAGYSSSKGGVFKTSTDADDLQVIHAFNG